MRWTNPLPVALIYLALRTGLAPLSPVPMAVPLDPLAVGVALRADRAKGAWFIVLLPGLVVGDLLAGLPWPVLAARLAGLGVILALSPKAGFHTRFLHALSLWGLWTALPSDWLGHYPVTYLALVVWIQGLLWWGLAAPRVGGGRVSDALSWLPFPVLLLFATLVLDSPALWPLPDAGLTSGLPLKVAATVLTLSAPAILAVQVFRRKRQSTPTHSVKLWT